jgi:hypothetical protein
LITRNHLDHAPRAVALKLTWEWATDPIGFVMTRKMLLWIKQRAEDSRFVVQSQTIGRPAPIAWTIPASLAPKAPIR